MMRLKYGLLCAFAPLLLATAPAQTTDIILTGGSILTMAGDQPEFVEAILLRNGKIAALGSLATVKKYSDTKL
jgi:predicted amidohydrolase YtcJ